MDSAALLELKVCCSQSYEKVLKNVNAVSHIKQKARIKNMVVIVFLVLYTKLFPWELQKEKVSWLLSAWSFQGWGSNSSWSRGTAKACAWDTWQRMKIVKTPALTFLRQSQFSLFCPTLHKWVTARYFKESSFLLQVRWYVSKKRWLELSK